MDANPFPLQVNTGPSPVTSLAPELSLRLGMARRTWASTGRRVRADTAADSNPPTRSGLRGPIPARTSTTASEATRVDLGLATVTPPPTAGIRLCFSSMPLSSLPSLRNGPWDEALHDLMLGKSGAFLVGKGVVSCFLISPLLSYVPRACGAFSYSFTPFTSIPRRFHKSMLMSFFGAFCFFLPFIFCSFPVQTD